MCVYIFINHHAKPTFLRVNSEEKTTVPGLASLRVLRLPPAVATALESFEAQRPARRFGLPKQQLDLGYLGASHWRVLPSYFDIDIIYRYR